MALQDGGTLSFFIRDVCVFFASFFLKKKIWLESEFFYFFNKFIGPPNRIPKVVATIAIKTIVGEIPPFNE